jgi:hypothetical protein
LISLSGTNFLEALLGGAVAVTEPTFYTSYGVADLREDFKTIDNNSGNFNGATEVTVVAAPGGTDTRHDVRDLVIFNVDTQINHVTLQVDVGGTKFKIWEGDIAPGGFARLENSTGRFVVYSALGEETSSGAPLVAHALSHESGGADEVDHDLLKNFVLGEHRLLDDASTTLTNLWSASKIQSELATTVDVQNSFGADQLDTPTGSDWAVNVAAATEADDNNAALIIRAFDDTTEEGVGLSVFIPVGATEVMFRFKSRARTAPGVANTSAFKVYYRSFPDNAAPSSWSAGTALTDIDIPTNENFQYDTQVFTLAALGLTAGCLYQFEFTRVAPSGGTDLTGDLLVLELQVEFNVAASDLSVLFSPDLLFPTNSDWAVNAHAIEAADGNDAALTVRRFDDTLEEGVGFLLLVPTTATQLTIRFKSRAEGAPGSPETVLPTLYTREFPDNSPPTAWTSGLDLTLISLPANAFFQYDEQTVSIASLSLAAGRFAQFELTRNSPDGSDDLGGDWVLAQLDIEFS